MMDSTVRWHRSRKLFVRTSVLFLVFLLGLCCGRRARAVLNKAEFYTAPASPSLLDAGQSHQRLSAGLLLIPQIARPMAPLTRVGLRRDELGSQIMYDGKALLDPPGHPEAPRSQLSPIMYGGEPSDPNRDKDEELRHAIEFRGGKSEQFLRRQRLAVFWEARTSAVLKKMPDWLLFSTLGVVTREIGTRDLQDELDRSDIIATDEGKGRAKRLAKRVRQNFDDKIQRALKGVEQGKWGQIGRNYLKAEIDEINSFDVADVISNEITVAVIEVIQAETWGRIEDLFSAGFQIDRSSAKADLAEVLRAADTDGNKLITLDEMYEYITGAPIASWCEPVARRWPVLQSAATAANPSDLFISTLLAQEVKKLRVFFVSWKNGISLEDLAWSISTEDNRPRSPTELQEAWEKPSEASPPPPLEEPAPSWRERGKVKLESTVASLKVRKVKTMQLYRGWLQSLPERTAGRVVDLSDWFTSYAEEGAPAGEIPRISLRRFLRRRLQKVQERVRNLQEKRRARKDLAQVDKESAADQITEEDVFIPKNRRAAKWYELKKLLRERKALKLKLQREEAKLRGASKTENVAWTVWKNGTAVRKISSKTWPQWTRNWLPGQDLPTGLDPLPGVNTTLSDKKSQRSEGFLRVPWGIRIPFSQNDGKNETAVSDEKDLPLTGMKSMSSQGSLKVPWGIRIPFSQDDGKNGTAVSDEKEMPIAVMKSMKPENFLRVPWGIRIPASQDDAKNKTVVSDEKVKFSSEDPDAVSSETQ